MCRGVERALMSNLQKWTPSSAVEQRARLSEQVMVEVLGVPDSRLATVSSAIQAGFRFAAFKRLAKVLGVNQGTLASLLGMSPGMVTRRRARDRFAPSESDRMWLLVRLYLRALEVHGTEAAAREWLSSPLPALGRRSALEMSKDSAGVQRALDVLGQIQHGVFG